MQKPLKSQNMKPEDIKRIEEQGFKKTVIKEYKKVLYRPINNLFNNESRCKRPDEN